jgi:ABC-type multidrug transport system ATPase subunit
VQLVIDRLSKTYPNGVRALNEISLTIGTGMFGLLGPNGAGKSTLMRTIATLQLPDSGSIRVGDIDVLTQPDEVRKILGYLPQEFGLYPHLAAEVTLDHFAALKGVTAAGERRDLVTSLLHQTNLWEARKKHVGTFSGGMRQRLGIAIALAGQPKLLIVDEPTAGLDPTERHRFLNLLGEIGQDIIVILSTHIVEDVRELCSAMAIINRGEVILAGDPSSIVESVEGKLWKKSVSKADLAAHEAKYQVVSLRLQAGRPLIHVYSESDPGDGFAPIEPDLEDVYFREIGRGTTAQAA